MNKAVEMSKKRHASTKAKINDAQGKVEFITTLIFRTQIHKFIVLLLGVSQQSHKLNNMQNLQHNAVANKNRLELATSKWTALVEKREISEVAKRSERRRIRRWPFRTRSIGRRQQR